MQNDVLPIFDYLITDVSSLVSDLLVNIEKVKKEDKANIITGIQLFNELLCSVPIDEYQEIA